MKYVVSDFTGFDRCKSNSDAARAAMVGYWCGDERRVASLRQGVVVHTVYERSDKKDQVKFTFDKSSCAKQHLNETLRSSAPTYSR